MDLKKVLHNIFLKSPQNLFDEFLIECQKWYSEPAHTLTEMRTRDNKKIRGDIFEKFCVLYLKHVLGYETVYLLEDVPEPTLTALAMKRKDMGIDIVVYDGTNYIAVQCKYKTKKDTKYTAVSWQNLSTFYALCMRTGPWSKYIVMTNCDYVRHQGQKTEKDMSITLNTLRSITKDQWLNMCEISGISLQINHIQSAQIKDIQSAQINSNQSAQINSNQSAQIKDIQSAQIKDIQLAEIKDIQLSEEELARPNPEQLRALRLAYYNNIN